jgi:hypothetical protein
MYRSFGITLRTGIGINDSHINDFDRWIKKQDYGAYVFEKEGDERHIHAQVWYNEAKAKGSITKVMKRHIINNYNPEDYVLRHAQKIKIAYNDEFLESYMEKDFIKDDDEGLGNFEYNKVPDITLDFYPSEEEQEMVQAKSKSKNGWLLELDELYKKYATEEEKMLPNIYNVAKFFERIAFLDLWKIMKDPKQRQQEAQIYRKWINKSVTGTLYLSKEQEAERELVEKWTMDNGQENQG